MEQYVIKGGRPLEGEVTIAGAKNAALGILAAAVMTDQEVTIETYRTSEIQESFFRPFRVSAQGSVT